MEDNTGKVGEVIDPHNAPTENILTIGMHVFPAHFMCLGGTPAGRAHPRAARTPTKKAKTAATTNNILRRDTGLK